MSTMPFQSAMDCKAVVASMVGFVRSVIRVDEAMIHYHIKSVLLEWQHRNEVNYDALIQAGAIDVETCIERVRRWRYHTHVKPWGAWSACGGRFYPAEGEVTVYLMERMREHHKSKGVTNVPWALRKKYLPKGMISSTYDRQHVIELVTKGLRGQVVPFDVQMALDDPRYDPGVMGFARSDSIPGVYTEVVFAPGRNRGD